MITKMCKLEIIGPKKHLLDTVDVIQSYGKLHIATTLFSEDEGAVFQRVKLREEEVQQKSRMEELMRRMDGVLSMLAETPDIMKFDKEAKGESEYKVPEGSDKLIEEGHLMSDEVESKIKDLTKRKLELKDELLLVRRFEDVINTFTPLMEKLAESKNLEILGFTIKKKRLDILKLLKEELAKVTENQFDVFTKEMDATTVAAVVAFRSKHMREVKRILVGERISELKMPEQYGDQPAGKTLTILREKLKNLPREIEEINTEIEKISVANYPNIFSKMRMTIQDRLAEFEAVSSVAQTKLMFVVLAWLPLNDLDEFMKLSKKSFDSSVVINRIPIEEKDVEKGHVPVKLTNPPLVRPFELCLKLYPLPKYGSIDPTIFVAIFFPIFFGMILGDVAYGLVLMSLALFLNYKFKTNDIAQSVSVVMLACALGTIVFGIVYGEFFGNAGHLYLGMPIFFNREEAIMPSLFLAVGVGVFHILFAIFLKFYNAMRRHHKHEAQESMITIIVLVLLFVALGVLAGKVHPGFLKPSIGLLVIGVVALFYLGGPVAALEIFGIVGNMLSYARIMAIGLSSVILAVVANRIGGMMGNVFLAMLVAGLIHLINIIIGMVGPTIHGLRLHYVEFMGKFFQSGKTVYTPFHKKMTG